MADDVTAGILAFRDGAAHDSRPGIAYIGTLPLQFVAVIMGSALGDQSHYTYADYRSWPEDTRYELVDGAAFMMERAPQTLQQDLPVPSAATTQRVGKYDFPHRLENVEESADVGSLT